MTKSKDTKTHVHPTLVYLIEDFGDPKKLSLSSSCARTAGNAGHQNPLALLPRDVTPIMPAVWVVVCGCASTCRSNSAWASCPAAFSTAERRSGAPPALPPGGSTLIPGRSAGGPPAAAGLPAAAPPGRVGFGRTSLRRCRPWLRPASSPGASMPLGRTPSPPASMPAAFGSRLAVHHPA